MGWHKSNIEEIGPQSNKMEVFKKGLIIDNWGAVFVGLKRQWLTSNEVMKYCDIGKIKCSKARQEQLRLALDESLFDFLEMIKRFIVEDGDPPIIWNEDSATQDFSIFPQQYLNFWEIEFLIRIVNSEEDKTKKLHQVASIHSVFNYPITWHNFLYYMPPPNNIPIGIESLYNNLLNYIDSRLNSNRISSS
jgi:hypothetical protein